MPEKLIQEQFGQHVIEVFAAFARADLKTPGDLEHDEFSHVSDVSLRRSLAQVHYGVRWIYKLGLALLTKDEERAAHVRAQIVDYASISEALLGYCIVHALRRNHVVGDIHNWTDGPKKQRPLKWDMAAPDRTVGRQSLWWLIQVAQEFRIINDPLAKDLDGLRLQRNTVHLRQRASMGRQAFLSQSKKAFTVTTRTIAQTKAWKATHP